MNKKTLMYKKGIRRIGLKLYQLSRHHCPDSFSSYCLFHAGQLNNLFRKEQKTASRQIPDRRRTTYASKQNVQGHLTYFWICGFISFIAPVRVKRRKKKLYIYAGNKFPDPPWMAVTRPTISQLRSIKIKWVHEQHKIRWSPGLALIKHLFAKNTLPRRHSLARFSKCKADSTTYVHAKAWINLDIFCYHGNTSPIPSAAVVVEVCPSCKPMDGQCPTDAFTITIGVSELYELRQLAEFEARELQKSRSGGGSGSDSGSVE